MALGCRAVQHLPGYLALLWASRSFSIFCRFTFSFGYRANDNRRDTCPGVDALVFFNGRRSSPGVLTKQYFLDCFHSEFSAPCALECFRRCVPTAYVGPRCLAASCCVISPLSTNGSRDFCYRESIYLLQVPTGEGYDPPRLAFFLENKKLSCWKILKSPRTLSSICLSSFPSIFGRSKQSHTDQK